MPSLTRDQILWAAIRIADDEGPDAVTLRRISSVLGVHVTSLYNHVPTRDAITDGMLEVLLAEAKLPTHPVPWEEWVRRFFAAVSDIATTHSGAFHATSHRPVQGARATASFEIAIAAFIQAGFSTLDAFAAVKTVVLLAGSVGQEQSQSARGESLETRLADLPAEAFPLVRSIAGTAQPEDAWAFALETVIAGLRARLEA
ncbi:TetR/AcrR family transcriptional regulator C-terminal domain-containing protein [Cryptosporangium japonicum]